ncbi:MAG TPA: hypothetical protein PKI11_21140, partial [Candidatus Hydrogenedentes bacterium]|nr:hypothetical protein [Candidatus Hydrogenedentota bacterium]
MLKHRSLRRTNSVCRPNCLLFAVIAACVFAGTARAAEDVGAKANPKVLSGNVLVFFDPCGGASDHVSPALANLGLTVTTHTNLGDFQTALTSGSWDLVIVDSYNNSISDAVLDDLVAYHGAVGKIIFSNWNLLGAAAHPFVALA